MSSPRPDKSKAKRHPSTPSPAKQRRICESRGWLTPKGHMLGIERGKIVTIKDGKVVHWDHTGAWNQTGDNTDENLRPLHPDEEHKPKTAEDRRAYDHTNRLEAKRLGTKEQAPKQKIRSRGFDKTLRKKMNGQVERRQA